MQHPWSSQDERRQEHGGEGERNRTFQRERGQDLGNRPLAGARHDHDRASREPTLSTGNPNVSYEDRTKDELYRLARERGIEGRSKMSKQQLIRALRR